VNWASGLGGDLTVTLYPGYTTSIDWSTGWQLPRTVDGEWEFGYDGTTTAGYNITTSEMGYLYYVSLGNLGYYATDGEYPQSGWGLQNTGDFENLLPYYYWSGTEYSAVPLDVAWDFNFDSGGQFGIDKDVTNVALAVRPGVVMTIDQALIDKAEELLESFDEAVADGGLVGTGNTKAAPGRLNALRNKLIEAEALLASGDYEGALTILYDIYNLCDGNPKPADLVEGGAAENLAGEVLKLIEMIEAVTS
jgi:hypothetical protein